MVLTSLITMAAEAKTPGPPPFLIGGICLAILLVLMLGLLTFGRGREHS